ncbi:hypothetical protein [Paenibacillus sp. GCM10028914]|uniref:hypothetical protein n=1 Tax=Paenibacillus sp. GCM10028914 TaxID=3273416 RepID=UPI0036220941
MLPVRIVLAVQDSGYVEPMLNFIHGSEYVKRVQVTAFTRMDALLQYGEIPDLIVGEVEMLEAWLTEGRSSVPWVVLSEGEDNSNLIGDGLTTAKYQPLPQLLDLWIAQTRGSRVSKNDSYTGSTLITGFVSVLGGSGRTTASVNMAKQLGVLGRKVFYLNLETVNSTALFPTGRRREDGGSFSRLLYEIKSSQETTEGTEISLAQYVMRHDGLKCDVFEPSDHLQELMEMTAGDVEVLIDLISKSGQYDVVVIDTDNQSEERLRTVMEKSNVLLWVLLDDLISMYKTGMRFGHMERKEPVLFGQIMGKSRFIVNRFTGSLANPLPHKDMRVDGMLPYIPSWKQLHQEDLLLCSPIFQRDILKLCSELLGESDWGVTESRGGRVYG